jgi:hypothetical protein
LELHEHLHSIWIKSINVSSHVLYIFLLFNPPPPSLYSRQYQSIRPISPTNCYCCHRNTLRRYSHSKGNRKNKVGGEVFTLNRKTVDAKSISGNINQSGLSPTNCYCRNRNTSRRYSHCQGNRENKVGEVFTLNRKTVDAKSIAGNINQSGLYLRQIAIAATEIHWEGIHIPKEIERTKLEERYLHWTGKLFMPNLQYSCKINQVYLQTIDIAAKEIG